MTEDELVAHCLTKPGAWPDEPWDGDLLFKVGNKIFVFVGPESTVGVKCASSRDEANEWLRRYPTDAAAMPYIGRYGWNTLRVGGAIADDEILEAIDFSYRAVLSKLPRKHRPTA